MFKVVGILGLSNRWLKLGLFFALRAGWKWDTVSTIPEGSRVGR